MLATGILLGSIVVLGELSRLGSRNVQAACAESEAERLAQSVMSEVIAAGGMPEPVAGQPLADAPGWLFSIEIEPLDRPALSALRISVAQDLPIEKQPVSFTLVRWRSFAATAADEGLSSSRAAAGQGAEPGATRAPPPAAAPRAPGSFP